jgi:hypothetical protein
MQQLYISSGLKFEAHEELHVTIQLDVEGGNKFESTERR